MHLRFAVQSSDVPAMKVVALLLGLGQQVVVLREGEKPLPSDIALFSSGGKFRHRFFSEAPYKFAHRGITVPAWVGATPFQVAINASAPFGAREKELLSAVKNLLREYSAWHPEQQDNMAPWHPVWHQEQAPPREFSIWHRSTELAAIPQSFEDRLLRHITPIFPGSKPLRERLIITGCAAFNRPHTDVVDRLEPRVDDACNDLAELARIGEFSEVLVIVAGEEVLQHEALRLHLHPFIFMAVDEAEELLGKKFEGQTRLWGRTHRRSDAEIAEAFKAGALAVESQLVEPLRQKLSVPVKSVSWIEFLGGYLDQAYVLARKNISILEGIYAERVATRPSYQTLHQIDPVQGLERTVGNAALYIGEALYLEDHPGSVTANCEIQDTYWRGLEPLLRSIWGKTPPCIGMVKEVFRQPWSY